MTMENITFTFLTLNCKGVVVGGTGRQETEQWFWPSLWGTSGLYRDTFLRRALCPTAIPATKTSSILYIVFLYKISADWRVLVLNKV